MADPGMIAAATQRALNRSMEAIQQISDRLGVPVVELAIPRHRNPLIQTKERMELLADWTTEVLAALEERNIDISGAALVNAQLETIRWVLDMALPHMTKRQLEEIGEELGVAIKASIKQEVVNEIVLALTGSALETVSLEDEAGGEASPDTPDAESDAETDEQVADLEDDEETPENDDFDAPVQETFEDED